MPALGRFTEMRNQSLRLVVLSVVLAVVTLALYWPVQTFDFVNYDDDVLVKDNRQIRGGLSREGLEWAFTTIHGGNWHPLTWISHMVDIEAYGLDAGGHHRTNALIHTANAVLLLIVLTAMTHSPGAGALVAILFAIHPLHVESVAWVAERKDVLSGFFWILTMGAYAWYVRRPTVRRYLLVAFSFAMGLLSKPMVVTLPFVLMLLDVWPLQRLRDARTVFDRWGGVANKGVMAKLVIEKLPLFFLSAVFSALTLFAQIEVSAVWPVDKMPVDVRLANALVSYMAYIRKMMWPVDLAVLYPHAGMPEAWSVWVSALLLVSMTVLAVLKMREMPFLIVGWLWYLGTLVPVIGIVQVGSQALADRYTYIPLVGLFIVLAWGVDRVVARYPGWTRRVIGVSIVTISVLVFLARTQVDTWKSSVTLFEHALHVTEMNPMAHQKIGEFYLDQNDCRNAVPHFLEAIRMKENFAYPYSGLGVCASHQTPPTGALYFFAKALEIDPRLTRALVDRGVLYMKQGKFDSAAEDFERVLRIRPDHEVAHTNLGVVYLRQGRTVDAETHLREALRVQPHIAEAHHNLGLILVGRGLTNEALAHFRQASALAPGNPYIEEQLKRVQTWNMN
jgi:Flp pilus assembly protein TadD